MNGSMMKRSRMAPYAIKRNDEYLMIGDKYVKHLLVTHLPEIFGLGMLSMYVSNPSIKVFMTTEPLKMNCASMLKKEYNDKLDKYNKSSDPAEMQRLQLEMESLNTYISEITINHDSTMNLCIVFQVQADDLKELRATAADLKMNLQTEGFRVIKANLLQEYLLRMMTPLFTNSGLDKTIEENIGIPLPSLGAAGLYPFIFETLKDAKGFILGHEMGNRGLICFDQFQYLNQPQEARQFNRLNGNLIIAGGSGFGKTTAVNLFARFYIRQRKKLIWIDPENKNKRITKKYKGTFIDWGKKGNIINIFDLKPITTDEEDDYRNKFDTRQAIFNNVEDIKIVLKYLQPSISDDTLSVISEVALLTYERAGIDVDKSFKGMDTSDYPTFSEFDESINELIKKYTKIDGKQKRVELLNDLQIKIEPLLNEHAIYFNGHTSIRREDEGRDIISFGTKVLFEKSTELRDALNHVMYKYAWSLCLDENKESAFLLDEAHVDIHTQIAAAMVDQFIRRSRKYNNACVIATQEPKDFALDKIEVHGKAMFNNSCYKIILHLEEDAIQELRKLMKFNESEKTLIENARIGDALFVCGSRRIPIHILPTDNEISEMN